MSNRNFKGLDDTFAAAFKLARVESGVSQDLVAERMRELGFDMSQPVIGKIERGQRRVSIGESEALSSIVNKSLSSLLAGPQFLKLDRAISGLMRLRGELQQAINRFQTGQQALAFFAGEVEREGELDPYSRERSEEHILESLEDVVEELRRDNIAANTAQRFRDDLDHGESGASAANEKRGIGPETHFGRYLARFGDTVKMTSEDGYAWQVVYGWDSKPDAEQSGEVSG